MDAPGNRRIAAAINWLAAHHAEQPSLARIAAVASMSPAHFSRSFRRWVGVSPKQFLEHLTLEDVKRRLTGGENLLAAGAAAGLSSLGRVHDHFITLEAMTPGEFRRNGSGVGIIYGYHASLLGEVLLARTHRGVCFLAFASPHERAFEELAATWPGARFVRDDPAIAPLVSRLFDGEPLRVHVRGTNFQVQVWRALLRIPEGSLVSYRDIAHGIHRPSSVRAVASAVGANPVSYLIPCHRVIRASGALGGYRWGLPCKRTLLAWEFARAEM